MSRKKRGFEKKAFCFEKGAVVKRNKGLIRLALVYPNSYSTGMSSLGFQTMYKLSNGLDNVACERVFLPDKKGKDQSLKSCETGLPLNAFDIVAFSISFENDYLNIINMLRGSGIPLYSTRRTEDHPLVMAGGVACFMNPEPVSHFFDCFLLGEAECLIKDFFKFYEMWKRETPGRVRRTLLEKLASQLPGAYVPLLYRDEYGRDNRFKHLMPLGEDFPARIPVHQVKDLSTIKTTTAVVTSQTAFKNIFLIETGRGCPHGCRFCSAGFVYRPPRFYPVDVIAEAMDDAGTLSTRVGLVSPAVSDHPHINMICAMAAGKNLKTSFSSLRVDSLSTDMIDNLVCSGTKTVTIAPEAGSERMRRIINKKISETDILSAVHRLVSAGIIHIKLYFMIGLPFETDADIEAIVALTLKIKNIFLEASRKQKKIGHITMSINSFVPKPGTPFQWTAMLPVSRLKNKLNVIKSSLKKVSNLRIHAESPRMSTINAFLARGDRRMAEVIETAAEQGWTTAFKVHDRYCRDQLYGQRPLHGPLPWDFIDTGIKKEFLQKEFSRAASEKISRDCPMIDCGQCRICR